MAAARGSRVCPVNGVRRGAAASPRGPRPTRAGPGSRQPPAGTGSAPSWGCPHCSCWTTSSSRPWNWMRCWRTYSTSCSRPCCSAWSRNSTWNWSGSTCLPRRWRCRSRWRCHYRPCWTTCWRTSWRTPPQQPGRHRERWRRAAGSGVGPDLRRRPHSGKPYPEPLSVGAGPASRLPLRTRVVRVAADPSPDIAFAVKSSMVGVGLLSWKQAAHFPRAQDATRGALPALRCGIDGC